MTAELANGKQRRVHILAFLRTHGRATAGRLSAETGANVRTIYRDLTELQAYGLPITGRPGDGYVWRGAREVTP